MGSKTISLEESAYQLLRGAKRANESFSQVVHRILAPRPTLAALVGALPKAVVDDMDASIAESRRADLVSQEQRRNRPS